MRCELSWEIAAADHAAVVGKLRWHLPPKERHCRSWRAEEGVDTVAVIAHELQGINWSLGEVHNAVLHFQALTHDRRTVKARRRARLPLQARALLQRASATSDAADRAAFKKTAWGIMRAHLLQQHANALNERVRRGVCVMNVSKLKLVEALTREDNTVAKDMAEMRDMIKTYFEAKWASGFLSASEQARDFMRGFNHCVGRWATSQSLLRA